MVHFRAGEFIELTCMVLSFGDRRGPILVDTGMPESAVNNEGLLTVHLLKDRFYRK